MRAMQVYPGAQGPRALLGDAGKEHSVLSNRH